MSLLFLLSEMEVNHKKRKSEEDNSDRPAKKQATDMSNKTDQQCLFLVDELVELILSNLLTKPKAVLNISLVSKRHHQLVNSKAMWLRFGFTDQISKEEIMPAVNLKFLLNSLRTNYIRRKTAAELVLLEKEGNDLYSEGDYYSIAAIQENNTATSVRDFLTNKKITDKAFEVFYHIMSRTHLLQHQISMETFVSLILSTEEQIQQEKTKRMGLSQCAQEVYYPNFFSGSYTSDLDVDGVNYYQPLLYLAEMSDENKHACVLKRFINADKFVIMVQGTCSFYFIKIDLSKNLIVSCGELQTYLGYTQNALPMQALHQRFNPKFAELFEVPQTARLAELELSKMCMCHYSPLSTLGGAERIHKDIPFLKKKL